MDNDDPLAPYYATGTVERLAEQAGILFVDRDKWSGLARTEQTKIVDLVASQCQREVSVADARSGARIFW